MVEASIANWESALEDLSIELSETAAPSDAGGMWLEALAEFSRHSFARLLLSPDDSRLRIRLEIALGPPGDEDTALADALDNRLRRSTETDWDGHTDQSPWLFETQLVDGDDDTDRLRKLVLYILELAEHFEAITSVDEWFDVLGRPPERTAPSETAYSPDSTSDSPFETIGDGSSDKAASSADSATIESWQITRVRDALRVAIGFTQVLDTEQLQALTQGLESHIHAKFDAQARRIEPDDRAELRLPAAARTVLYLEIYPAGYPDGLKSLKKDVHSFLERLEKFGSYGVDLFEYLGVADTVLNGGGESGEEQTLSFERRTSRRERPPRDIAGGEADEAGVVLDLGAPAATDTLESKDYTDPRLRREDATTRLVDIVLRHPGYSDRRIGQVLSILLSIEYHDAVDIADSAPCVIAWGIGRQRAQSFKDVIENAGGKVVLVEPGTFGED